MLSLVLTLVLMCLVVLGVNVSPAFASTSSHVSVAQAKPHEPSPNVSGGGCGRTYVIVTLYACVSEGGNVVVPDAYISPGRSDYSSYSSCSLVIYLYDVVAGSKTTGNANCIAPLQQGYQGHYYGKSVTAAGGHAYYTEAIATYTYRGVTYMTDVSSPVQYT